MNVIRMYLRYCEQCARRMRIRGLFVGVCGVRLVRGEKTKTLKINVDTNPLLHMFAFYTRPKNLQTIMHQYPLYRISYCADDKVDRQFISFIVKEQDSEQHTCFVFLSDKLSEEITITIGQAFELAYK